MALPSDERDIPISVELQTFSADDEEDEEDGLNRFGSPGFRVRNNSNGRSSSMGSEGDGHELLKAMEIKSNRQPGSNFKESDQPNLPWRVSERRGAKRRAA